MEIIKEVFERSLAEILCYAKKKGLTELTVETWKCLNCGETLFTDFGIGEHYKKGHELKKTKLKIKFEIEEVGANP